MKNLVLTAMMMGIIAVTPVLAHASEQTAQTEASQEKIVSFADAVQTALEDAGLEKDAVKFSKQMRTYEDGMPVYEIKFVVPGEAKYEYVIDDKTGEIKKKESEAWEAEDDADYAALLKENQNFFDYEADETQIVVMPASSKVIEECAKDRETDLVEYQYGMEYEDGRIVYELCAMFPTEMKFEYKFDMKTGEVISSEKEGWEAEDNAQYRDILESKGLNAQ